tara:strand:+ start:2483 stop:2911 length:429 start_codon:yes stop_codon:yes gene_type:complete
MSSFQSNDDALLASKVLRDQERRSNDTDGFIPVKRKRKGRGKGIATMKQRNPAVVKSWAAKVGGVGNCTPLYVKDEPVKKTTLPPVGKRSYAAAMIQGPSAEQHIEAAKRAFKSTPVEESNGLPWVIERFNWADECDSDNED